MPQNSQRIHTPQTLMKLIIKNIILLIIFQMINGMHDGWGYIQPYISSYLHIYDPHMTTSKVHILYAIILLSSIISAFLFQPLTKIFSHKGSISFSFIMMSSGLTVCYFSKTLTGMIIGFSLIGLGITLQFLIAGFLMMALMPMHLGLAAGFSIVGHALSPIYWGYISQYLLNPENIKPKI